MTQNRRRQGGPIKAAEDVLPEAPPDPLAALRDQAPTEQRGDLPDLSGSGEQTPAGEGEPPTTPVAGAGPGPEPVGQLLVTLEDQEEAVAVALATLHADTTALGFLHKGDACGCRYITRAIVRTVLPLNAVGETDAEVCERMHPGEDCRPGDNHPGAA